MIVLIPLLVSLVLMLRTGLIMMGVFKEPILRTFEKYGDAETLYHPLPSLLLWGGILVFCTGPWLAGPLGSWFPIVAPAVLLLAGAYYVYTHPELAKDHPQIFLSFPRWYYELRERTTRYERRRLAYMWLWLPLRMRMALNGSDYAFNQWADLVIMATMVYDDELGTRWDTQMDSF